MKENRDKLTILAILILNIFAIIVSANILIFDNWKNIKWIQDIKAGLWVLFIVSLLGIIFLVFNLYFLTTKRKINKDSTGNNFVEHPSKEVDCIAEIINTRISENPFSSGYRCQLMLRENDRTSAIITFLDRDQLFHNDSTLAEVRFIIPGKYPNTLWLGRRVSIYEASRCVGFGKIVEIRNKVLLRATESNRSQNILTDYKVLNIALKRQLEWGKEYDIPLDNKLMSSIPDLSSNEIDILCEYINNVSRDCLWNIYYNNWDNKNQDFKVDCQAIINTKYPWIDKENLASIGSQGLYYAWHG